MHRHSYFPHARQHFHLHAETRIVVLLAGEFREETFGAAGVFSRGDVIVRPAYACHGDWASLSGATYLQIKASPALVTRNHPTGFWKPMRGVVNVDDDRVRSALASAHAAEFLLERATIAAYDGFQSADGLERAARRLCENADVGIAVLAGQAGLRADSFSRAFKLRFGVAPQVYAKMARLERAMAKVSAGEESAAEIAASCGYFDQSHLCRSFRRHLGMTPLSFSREFAR